jgi:hypothetical protein
MLQWEIPIILSMRYSVPNPLVGEIPNSVRFQFQRGSTGAVSESHRGTSPKPSEVTECRHLQQLPSQY